MESKKSSSLVAADFEKWMKGEQAWDNSCLACHGAIDTTSLRGVNHGHILDALELVPRMEDIIISEDEIDDIVYALKFERPPVPPGFSGRLGKKYTCDVETSRGESIKNWSRHSYQEIHNNLSDLFGGAIIQQFGPEMSVLPKDNHLIAEGFVPVLSSEYFDAMTLIGEKLSGAAISDSQFIERFSGCTNLNSEACQRELLVNFSSRALKRPIPTSEINGYMTALTNDAGVDMDTLILAILLRSEFALNIEGGTIDKKRYRLDSYDVASRISFRTTGRMPDDELWAAAVQGKLTSLAQVETQVARLMNTPEAKEKIADFFRQWMHIEPEAQVSATDLHRNGIVIADLYEAALNDFDQFINYIVFEKKGKLSDLFLDPSIFPETQALADVYGSELWEEGRNLASTNGHIGVLLRPATLIGGSNMTPIIQRGVHVRRGILCDSLPTPTQDIIDSRDTEQDPDELDHAIHPNRDVVKNLTKASACLNCHTQINPIGFSLEGFDSLGRAQTMENFFSMDDLVVQHVVDTVAEDPVIENGGPTVLNGAADLNNELALSDKVRSCFAKKLTINLYKRDTLAEDECAMSDKEAMLRNPANTLQDVFVKNIANEDIFWRSSDTE